MELRQLFHEFHHNETALTMGFRQEWLLFKRCSNAKTEAVPD
jgi:hypothetical protein